MRHYWLLKSEPSCFSIENLASLPQQTTAWDGVRNYQARNYMCQQMQVGDLGFFYHSSCTPPGIVGIVEVVKAAYPDDTAFDPNSDHPDPKSTPSHPRWFMVDVRLKNIFPHMLSLDTLKHYPELEKMMILRKGNRLSITPVTTEEWEFINCLI